MAVDTSRKRASIVSIGLLFVGPGIVPDGSIDQGDRQAIGYSYAGVLDAVPAAGFVCLRDLAMVRGGASIAMSQGGATLTMMRC